jgi:hypothetical protein
MFSAALYFRKVVQEIFSKLDKTKTEVFFFRNEDEVHRRDEEAPQGGETRPRRGLGPGRA